MRGRYLTADIMWNAKPSGYSSSKFVLVIFNVMSPTAGNTHFHQIIPLLFINVYKQCSISRHDDSF